MTSNTEGASQIELDALKTLYGGYLENLHASSERSFRTVLQTLTLNVAVVAGLVGLAAGGVTLSEWARWFGSTLLLVFNFAVIAYLWRQATFYIRERAQFKNVRKALLDKCPGIKAEPEEGARCICCPLWSGSTLFCVAVVIAASCSIAALWVPLLALSAHGPNSANPALQGTPASGRP